MPTSTHAYKTDQHNCNQQMHYRQDVSLFIFKTAITTSSTNRN